MNKDDVSEGEVYLSRAQSEEYKHRFSIIEVVEVPDDDHPDVIGKRLFSNHSTGSGGRVSMSPRMFEERLYDCRN